MALLEESTCKIESLNSSGLGVGRTERGMVDLPYTIPGEVASFERHGYRKKSNCLLKGIEQKSEHRIAPACRYFGRCGGCLLQHLDKETYDNFKLSLVTNALESETKINSIITIPSGNRRRINLQALKKDDKIFLGFHRLRSHQIIDIEECPAMMPGLSSLLKPLRELMEILLEHRQKAEIFLLQASNGIDMLLELHGLIPASASQEEAMIEFAKNNGLIRLQFRCSKKPKVLFESEKPYIILGDKMVATDARSFMQASFDSDRILSDLVDGYLPQEKAALVDLFCGRGTFALPLSKRFSVDGFESDSSALAALGQASEGSITLHQRDLFEKPLTTEELRPYRFVVINPPRAGALEQVKILSASLCQRIVYVSCNPETFARDAKILEGGGYRLLEVTPVDQFYWSVHLEVVGVFSRTE
jgi:23S rRNA (uracil1939-C5)-methyltransferase